MLNMLKREAKYKSWYLLVASFFLAISLFHEPTAAKTHSVKLNWRGTAPWYNVYRSTDAGTKTRIARTSATHFVDSNVESGKTYYYAVSSENKFGESERIEITVVVPEEPK